MGCSQRRVMYFRKSDKKKLTFRRVDSEKTSSHPGRDMVEHFASE